MNRTHDRVVGGRSRSPGSATDPERGRKHLTDHLGSRLDALGSRLDSATSREPATDIGAMLDGRCTLKEAVRHFEGGCVLAALQRVGSNKRAAARLLGISLASLYRKLDRRLEPRIARLGIFLTGGMLAHLV